MSKLPAGRFRFEPGRRGGCAKERFHLGEGPRRLFCWCFPEMGALRIFMFKKSKMDRTEYPKQPKWSQKGTKVSQGTFKNTPCGTRSKKYPFWYPALIKHRFVRGIQIIKFRSQNHQKISRKKKMEFDVNGMPKWRQSRCPNSSKTYPK